MKKHAHYIDQFILFMEDLLAFQYDFICFKKDDELFSVRGTVPALEDLKTAAKFLVSDDGMMGLYLDLDRHQNHSELIAIAHESRHAYQYIICNEDEESEDAKTWKKEMQNYIPFGNKGYYNQTIEIDATAFAIYIFYILFGVVTETSGFDKEAIKQTIYYIAEDMSKEEIVDSASYARFDYKKMRKVLFKYL